MRAKLLVRCFHQYVFGILSILTTFWPVLIEFVWPFILSDWAVISILRTESGKNTNNEKARLKCAAGRVHFKTLPKHSATKSQWRILLKEKHTIVRMTGLPQKSIWKVCCSKSANKKVFRFSTPTTSVQSVPYIHFFQCKFFIKPRKYF